MFAVSSNFDLIWIFSLPLVVVNIIQSIRKQTYFLQKLGYETTHKNDASVYPVFRSHSHMIQQSSYITVEFLKEKNIQTFNLHNGPSVCRF